MNAPSKPAKKAAASGMSKEIQLAILRACGRYIRKSLAPVEERLKSMEGRLSGIESKGIVYQGVWQAAQEYKRGDLATHDGSLWHANIETRSKPGTGSEWSLAVKRGDGR